MADTQPGVFHRSIQSGKWFVASVVTQRLISLASFLVLARLLIPEDYGVMTIVYLVTSVLNQVTSPSLGDALLQRKDSIERYLDAYWTFDLFRNALLGILVFIFGNALSHFFNVRSSDMGIIQAGGFLLVIQGLANIRQTYFFRDLNFYKIFIRDFGAQIAFAIGAVGFAVFVDASAWALLVGALAQNATAVVIGYALYPVRPRFNFQFKRLRDLVHFSKWVYGQSLVDLLLGQADKFIVGRWLSPAQLGLYAKAKDLSSMATAVVTSMIKKIGLSAFSRVQDQVEKVRDGFLKSVDILSISSLPAALFLLLEGGQLVQLFLGPKWLAIVIPLKIFAFGNLFLSFTRIAGPVLSALGRPDINFKISALQAIVSLPLMYVGMRYGQLTGLAYAVVLTWLLLFLYVIYRTRPIVRISKHAFVPSIVSAGAACIATLLIDIILRRFGPVSDATAVVVGRLCLLGVSYYLILFFISYQFGKGAWHTLMAILQELGMKRKAL